MAFRGKVGFTGKAMSPSTVGYSRSISRQMKHIEDMYSLFVDQMKESTADVLLEALTPTFNKSLEYVPKLTLALMHSGYLEVREQGRKVQAEMGYGRGGNPPYAALQHEDLQFRHKPPTRAKYLQSALEEDASAIPARIVAKYKEITGA